MKSSGWVIVVFENEYKKFDGEVAYVKGPFEQYQDATDWAENDEHCTDGEWQITFLDPAPAKAMAA